MSFSRPAFILSVRANEHSNVVILNCNFADCEKVCPTGSDTFRACLKYLLCFDPIEACFECIISNRICITVNLSLTE